MELMVILYAADECLEWIMLFDDIWQYLQCNECVWLVPGTEIE